MKSLRTSQLSRVIAITSATPFPNIIIIIPFIIIIFDRFHIQLVNSQSPIELHTIKIFLLIIIVEQRIVDIRYVNIITVNNDISSWFILTTFFAIFILKKMHMLL